MTTDEFYMKRALELAVKAKGHTSPNPMVGAVIVKDNRIIGEGYHQKAGEPHAEVNAVQSAEESVKGATIYVTLEPCSHFGKTPPCSDLIIRSEFKKVVVATLDPNPLVAGRGLKRIEEAGIEVEVGVCEKESVQMNEVFNYFITTKQPFTVMKYAMTLDGKIATETGQSKWISSKESREHAHRLRGELSGIMAGIGTVLKDNPQLTCRVPGYGNPIRIVVDSQLRIPLDAAVLADQNEAKTVILTTQYASEEKLKALEAMSIEVIKVRDTDKRVDLSEAMQVLGEKGIDSILLEGGGKLNASALEAGIVNKVTIYIAPKLVGGENAISPVMGRGVKTMSEAYLFKDTQTFRIGEDIVIEALIDRSE
ncbi:MAG: bifunctional diaminohydroxyphosphoribosylaminopyrimidine deaminase/5-amino-6-(5-phosphoribosylamino)uracil reductase RibD [Alkalibacterium sp.]|nr:bifunctional diaminohydroxyphosphoribosylaminopyrimidine deaminase/5-amino-6-(5-phosphoribosylamino)uracil reductase RibD [Alkalibacterium sp.]TVP91715.1 MAG: bifunctional diaminohydroxyphosphoribosylaminopyrimidine deaminase/5-amino-6-(5-phosphoribosylamino)uracil reductase RibD [Alkalibacterium sp.]